ncbi:ribosome-associated translation inhibitor RaiA [Vibrio fluvialis]|jgi:ribosome-associated inhibitor A|uniref:Ribosome-associated translation inhibitor RaiA n=1 Tax=Vibrio fluvialis TaxID=676 RepID=A0AAX2LKM0_VIBFL|nr:MULTISPECIES: ribosome-associated translation inhibitor RaiA [Vibrio]TNF17813.1 MAG: ribosome-associated translation inhibitor RaiA [Vibrionaceae bacterium]HDM8034238.1 ribosome-associated translation inhibitor RaiA [Vibrio fluvialis clinical-1]AMF93633.1 ribosome-associated translation inhibitor RaiA [Vibrio fluvialis]AVH32250.1 ribosome-associated translation inhibitor RaiA [Vibrio fluvialis]EKO3369369.1 ribosome-associated translation inhibitor RaiA [Vibrio fluvialis]
MQMNITGKNIEITSAIRNHIESKFKKLEKWQVDIIGCQASFSEEPNKQKKFEATVSIPKGQLIASAVHDDLYAAINEVEQKLERQLNKLRHKPEARRTDKPELEEEVEE